MNTAATPRLPLSPNRQPQAQMGFPSQFILYPTLG